MRYLTLAGVLVAQIVLDANAGQATPKRKPKTHTVVMEATAFAPATLTVVAGDSVVWTNKDPFPHTATSKAAGFDSQPVQSEKSWKYVASKKGEFPYVCTLHPTMKGVLQVK
jgi:plastocyanin